MSQSWRSVRILLVLSFVFGGLASGAHAAPVPRADALEGVLAGRDLALAPSAPLAGLQAQEAPQFTFGQVLPVMDRVGSIVRDLQAELDRSQFDLDALDAALDYDAGQILAFVRTQIAFEQYPGVLRGELGTLIGRAGNAFDQALLVRRLLDDAGYETRLARTTLSDAQARSLVAQMARPRAAAPPVADPEALAGLRERFGQLSASPSAAAEGQALPDKYAAARDLTAADSAQLLDLLKRAGVALGGVATADALAQEARDYLWVQYRLGPYDPWIDAHVALSPAAAPARLTPQQFFRDRLPDDLYHRLRLQVTVEQKLGDKLIATPVVSSWERRAADLVGHPVTFQNQPDTLDAEVVTDIPTLLKEAHVFVPFLDGKMADRGFDLAGGTYSAGLISMGALGMAQVGQSTTGVAAEIASALGGSEPVPESTVLTAQWIDYTLVAPGGQQTGFRRYVMDRVGEANRKQGIAEIADAAPLLEAARALLTGYTIMVLPGEYTPAYISHRVVERSLGELKIRDHVTADGGLDRFPLEEIRALVPLQDALLNGALANAIDPQGHTLAYRAAPTLAVLEGGLVPGRPEGTAYERVDVLNNARRVLRVKDGSVTPAPEEAVRIGVWETFAERAPLRGPGQPTGAPEAIRRATADGAGLRVLRPGDGATLQALEHSAATKASVQRDLEAGYVVILPERPASGDGQTGWWRVQATTGETLGISTGGYGAEMVEYVITGLFSTIFAFMSYNNCRHEGGSAGCCLTEAVVWAVYGVIVGFGIGEAASYLTSWGWGFSFLIGDVGLGLGSTFIPSVCS